MHKNRRIYKKFFTLITFKNKTVFITGASRGIGRAMALKLAQAGANIVIAAKSITEDSRLGGTIFSVADEINKLGGKALPIQLDIRFEDQIQSAINEAVSTFGGIDILINNASAIRLTNTEQTENKHFNLMYDVNVRGTFLTTKTCIPYLKKSNNAHILNISPPLNIQSKWFSSHIAYTISKYSMSMLILGWAEEFKPYGIAANALWPKTTIATAAVKNLLGGDSLLKKSRKPDIVADAAHHILLQPSAICSGNFFIDEDVLKNNGIKDFSIYSVDKSQPLQIDLFVE